MKTLVKAMHVNRVVLVAAAGFVLFSSACNSQDLSRGKVKSLLEAKPVEFLQDSAMIALSDEEVSCAVGKGLLMQTGFGPNTVFATDQGERAGLFSYGEKGPKTPPSNDKDLTGKFQIHIAKNAS